MLVSTKLFSLLRENVFSIRQLAEKGGLELKKSEALMKWTKELAKNSETVGWYDKTMKGNLQATTIEDLERGIKEGKITVREALIFALIVGIQWNEKFEET